jgi:hypothetical protein
VTPPPGGLEVGGPATEDRGERYPQVRPFPTPVRPGEAVPDDLPVVFQHALQAVPAPLVRTAAVAAAVAPVDLPPLLPPVPPAVRLDRPHGMPRVRQNVWSVGQPAVVRVAVAAGPCSAAAVPGLSRPLPSPGGVVLTGGPAELLPTITPWTKNHQRQEEFEPRRRKVAKVRRREKSRNVPCFPHQIAGFRIAGFAPSSRLLTFAVQFFVLPPRLCTGADVSGAARFTARPRSSFDADCSAHFFRSSSTPTAGSGPTSGVA